MEGFGEFVGLVIWTICLSPCLTTPATFFVLVVAIRTRDKFLWAIAIIGMAIIAYWLAVEL